MLKLKREKLLWETHHKAAREIPDRQERKQIEELREELRAVQEELMRTEKRSKLNVKRLEDKSAALQRENDELKQEVHTLEQLRLNAWEGSVPGSSTISGLSPPRRPRAIATAGSGNEPLRDAHRQSPRARNNGHKTPEARSPVRQHRQRSNGGESRSSPWRNIEDEPPIGHPPSAPATVTASSSDSALPAPSSYTDSEGAVVTEYANGKIEKTFPDGSKLVTFVDGTVKEIFIDGRTVVHFFNGDVKQTFPDHQVCASWRLIRIETLIAHS